MSEPTDLEQEGVTRILLEPYWDEIRDVRSNIALCLRVKLAGYIFTELAPLGRFSHRVDMSVAGGRVMRHRVPGPLRSRDQFQASHQSSPHLKRKEKYFLVLDV